jgi:hypothetical protein
MSDFADQKSAAASFACAEPESSKGCGEPCPAACTDLYIQERTRAIQEDHEFIKDYLAPAAVLTLSKEFITLLIIRTQYSRVQLKIRFTEKYPNEVPTVEISSLSLPLPLLQNKEKECIENARKYMGKSQLRAIYEPIHTFIQTNLFVPCWKEMKQIASLCEGKGKVSIDEKLGLIQLHLVCAKYVQVIKLTVPYNYPEEGIKIEFLASNFPTDIQYMFLSQCEEIVRRCVAGCTAEQALQVSNPIKLADTGVKSNSAPVARLTTDNLKNLKHDVNVLKQISDLRVASTAGDKKKYVTQVTAERRAARRELRKLSTAESATDEAEHKALLQQEHDEMQALVKGKASEIAQPSLFTAVQFLVNDFVARLPLELCQACQKPVLPQEPSDPVSGSSVVPAVGGGSGPTAAAHTAAAAKSASTAGGGKSKKESKQNQRPMRTFCGHWLHYGCLNEWLSTPPFVRSCPVCARRIWHPDWPEDYRQLEKAWQTAEAKKREMCDVSGLIISVAVSYVLFLIVFCVSCCS